MAEPTKRPTDEQLKMWLNYPKSNERDAFMDRQELAAELLELRRGM